jgi:ParB family chromosome partitioning protein
MAKMKGLGKGLDALLGDDFTNEPEVKSSLFLPISQVESCASQPRKQFDPDALADLADSIRQHGIIQPLTVRKLQSGYYQIIAGERRWRAARMAGLSQVPVVVIEADDRKAMELAMIENLQREDLNPMEEAEGYHTLMEQYGLTQEETSQRVGKSRSAVANALRLLNLCKEVRALVEEGKLTGGHARALVPLTADVQQKAAAIIVKDDLSVRQTELLVKKLTAEKPDKPAKDATSVDYAAEAARELGERLGRPCKIVTGKKKGRIELEYFGMDDLNALLEALHQLKH